MSDSLETVLRSLRDVDGVIGSFVLSREGGLDARDLPEYFDAAALLEAGPRVERLYEAWKSLDTELETASLVFADHRLHLREVGSGYLAVVSAAEVNAPALRMAIGMVSRRLSAALEARASTPPSSATSAGERGASWPAPPPTPGPAPAGNEPRVTLPPEPSAHDSLGPKPRVYRGQVVR